MDETLQPFDFQAFKRAFEGRDAQAWRAFFADDAEWIEYRNQDPPERPRRIVGGADIQAYIESLVRASPTRSIEAAIVSAERVAFRAWTELPGGRRIVEHVMIEIAGGKIRRQVDVEAWDLLPAPDSI